MKLNNLFDSLQDNLLNHSILYIPCLNYLEYDRTLSEYLNMLLVIKEDGAMYPLDLETMMFYVSAKKQYLEKNVFQLLDAKKMISPNEFELVLSKYLEQLEYYVSGARWMNSHLNTFIKVTTNIVKTSFEIQQSTLEKHQKEIKEFCSLKTEEKPNNIQVEELIENHYEQLTELLGKNVKNETPLHKVKQNKRKKAKPISNEEAEQFLLETIFSVNIN